MKLPSFLRSSFKKRALIGSGADGRPVVRWRREEGSGDAGVQSATANRLPGCLTSTPSNSRSDSRLISRAMEIPVK